MADDLNMAESESQTILSGGPEVGEAQPVESEGQAPQPSEGSALPKWTEQLPREYRESFATYESYKDFVAAARDALSVKDRAVVLPDEDAGKEQWDAFYAAVGRPEAPEGYELPADTDLAEKFRQAAYEAGLTPSQAKGLAEWFDATTREQVEAATQQIASETEAVKAQLKQEWGAEFDANLANIRRFGAKYGKDDIQEAFQNPAIGNNPALIRLIAKAGADLAPDSLVEGTPTSDAVEDRGHFVYPWMREKYPVRD